MSAMLSLTRICPSGALPLQSSHPIALPLYSRRVELVAPVAEGALGELHDVPLVHQGNALALVCDGVVNRRADEPLGALARDRLDADAGGVGETNLGDLHLFEQELDHLFRFGRLGLPFDAGVDVLGVLAKNDSVEILWILYRAGRALEVAYRAQADVEVQHLAQRDVERADSAAHRRGQRPLDSDQVFLERLDGLVGQPVVELVEGFFACPHFHPRDLALAAVDLLDRVVEDVLRGAPDVRPGTIALDERNDRPLRHLQLAARPHRDFLAVARNLYRLERHLP